MNTTIDILQNRTSHRAFEPNYQLSDDELNSIINSSKQAPTWVNGQPYSIIILRGDKKQQLVEKLDQPEYKDFFEGAWKKQVKQLKDCSVFLYYCKGVRVLALICTSFGTS